MNSIFCVFTQFTHNAFLAALRTQKMRNIKTIHLDITINNFKSMLVLLLPVIFCLLALAGCQQVSANRQLSIAQQVQGVWEITHIEDPEMSKNDIFASLIQQRFMGARIFVYPDGIATLVVSEKQVAFEDEPVAPEALRPSVGRYMVHENTKSVVFRFGKTPIWLSAELDFKVKNNRMIFSRHGFASMILTKRDLATGAPPQEAAPPWDKIIPAKDKNWYTSSDGGADHPGVSGSPPPWWKGN